MFGTSATLRDWIHGLRTLGLFVVLVAAFTWAFRLYGSSLRTEWAQYIAGASLTVRPIASLPTILDGSKTNRLTFNLRNRDSHTLRLQAHAYPCTPAYLEGLPQTLGPGQECRVDLVLSPNNYFGSYRLGASITTNDPSSPPVVVETGEVFIINDTLTRSALLADAPPRLAISSAWTHRECTRRGSDQLQ